MYIDIQILVRFQQQAMTMPLFLLQWNLVCSREWQIALSQSLYMLGFLIGGMTFGNLSDV